MENTKAFTHMFLSFSKNSTHSLKHYDIFTREAERAIYQPPTIQKGVGANDNMGRTIHFYHYAMCCYNPCQE